MLLPNEIRNRKAKNWKVEVIHSFLDTLSLRPLWDTQPFQEIKDTNFSFSITASLFCLTAIISITVFAAVFVYKGMCFRI